MLNVSTSFHSQHHEGIGQHHKSLRYPSWKAHDDDELTLLAKGAGRIFCVSINFKVPQLQGVKNQAFSFCKIL